MIKITVTTPSRLHFTLIDLNGELGRVDGGVGAALETPGWEIEVEPSRRLEAQGLCRRFAEKFVQHLHQKPPVSIRVLSSIPQHVGLGSATQLALAVGKALAEYLELKLSVTELAALMGRGGTSGIGVAAFQAGGIILDGGHSFGAEAQKREFLPSRVSKAPPPPILARVHPPPDWFFVVAVPDVSRGQHGRQEVEVFKTYCPLPSREVDKLARIILMKLWPSLVEGDASSFGAALTEIQGIGFKKIEHQLQAPIVRQIIDFMLEKGALGAGMSSFGPAVYGFIRGKPQAERLKEEAQVFLEEETGGLVYYSRVSRRGALLKKAGLA
ncbi:beta-ribofuranosylaminobenzene 5'-phosphate synthase [Candidatus Hecatella orcuttiae]|jgi:beta-ribofuranosylaminobenzene 5'-phosphate synthase|uniref:beta-ribofuranosylaminobenzene 5'-phosphate synthase n=1 Tax=Candidatus Hecatella orcuttiae TaxID=1935119 RepID=UPI002867E8B2|nr:beta-ribofuranosylaminobenzene 5'-phosphate synthase [Candidatus Hecatella orcuttiae]